MNGTGAIVCFSVFMGKLVDIIEFTWESRVTDTCGVQLIRSQMKMDG